MTDMKETVQSYFSEDDAVIIDKDHAVSNANIERHFGNDYLQKNFNQLLDEQLDTWKVYRKFEEIVNDSAIRFRSNNTSIEKENEDYYHFQQCQSHQIKDSQMFWDFTRTKRRRLLTTIIKETKRWILKLNVMNW